MSGNGCANGAVVSAFSHHSSNARFEARVAQPQASAGSRAVARSDVPTRLYVLNAMPFTVLPETLTILQLTMPWRERPRIIDFSECGTFVTHGSELWSFAPLPVLSARLEPIVDREASVTVAREEVEASLDTRRILSWLLRRALGTLSDPFQGRGLSRGRSETSCLLRRAEDKESRTIVWNSPQRRGNRRDVVKKRGEGARTWFENEGFGYDIVQIGTLWCVRIKPFYMFTGRNARTPLPSFARASKATSRIKFDRNKNVEADLMFWSSFLGRGNETINIGDLHVDDLLVDSSFLTVEVPEIGLISDDPNDKDRSVCLNLSCCSAVRTGVEPRRVMARAGAADTRASNGIRIALVGPAEDVQLARRWLPRLNGVAIAREKSARRYRDWPGAERASA